MDTLNQRLCQLHAQIREHMPGVVRVSVALYDADTDEIRTFLASPLDRSPLNHYGVALASAGWLDAIRQTRAARVINELPPGRLGAQDHSRQIESAGFRASYTAPIFDDDSLVGFVFFNADQSNYFQPQTTAQLDLFVNIIGLMVERALQSVATLTGGVHLLRSISHFRNDETGNHLSRMAHYSGLIAGRIADQRNLSDDWVEYVQLFAPMHDIGKITMPDAILLKPGQLSDVEMSRMRDHAVRGEAILKTLLDDLALGNLPHVQSLLHIARHHHERWDGNGYPDGLKGEAIPLEARIVTVADVFDALTTQRCYKPAWSMDDACAYLRRESGHHVDPHCVDALLADVDALKSIRDRFTTASVEAT